MVETVPSALLSARLQPEGPSISVVMPVRDGERHLAPAIDSILSQSFGDFELITVDDGSTDGTRDILHAYEREDARVHVVRRDSGGFVAAVSAGISASSASWIARMDADDLSHPERLKSQWEFLETHETISLLGTTVEVIDDDGSPLSVIRYPLYDALIRLSLRASTTFAHGSVMFRRDLMTGTGGYHGAAFPAEDYDLWCRMVIGGARAANLDAPLYQYRLSPDGVSRTQTSAQRQMADHIGKAYGRSTVELPSLGSTLHEVRLIEDDVREERADGRALRRASRSLLDAVPKWAASRPLAAVAAMAGALDAEIRYRHRRRHS